MPPQSTATADLSKHRCSFNHDAIRWVRRVFGQTGARRVLCAEPAATCKSTHLIRLPISALITMQPISATWRPSLNTRVVSSLELLRISRESRWSLWTHVFLSRLCRAAHITCYHCDHRCTLNALKHTSLVFISPWTWWGALRGPSLDSTLAMIDTLTCAGFHMNW